jgi:hypothetical protein
MCLFLASNPGDSSLGAWQSLEKEKRSGLSPETAQAADFECLYDIYISWPKKGMEGGGDRCLPRQKRVYYRNNIECRPYRKIWGRDLVFGLGRAIAYRFRTAYGEAHR